MFVVADMLMYIVGMIPWEEDSYQIGSSGVYIQMVNIKKFVVQNKYSLFLQNPVLFGTCTIKL